MHPTRSLRHSTLALLLGIGVLAGPLSVDAQEPVYDLVLAGGRVMDPESGLDAVRNVGVRDGRIAAVSAEELRGREVVDVTGLVVAPGFIDLHAHGQDIESSKLQALDGVTTQLEMEVGVYPVAPWLASKEGKAIIHYGASVGHIPARIALLDGWNVGHLTTNAEAQAREASGRLRGMYQEASREEIARLGRMMAAGLDEGGIGFGFGINYTPAATPAEIEALFGVAATRGAPVFVHTRDWGIAPIDEALTAAERTGVRLHIVHIGSSASRQIEEALARIDAARQRGVDVTTEAYPYNAASTYLQSAIFNEGWQDKMGIGYGDLEWPSTGERLTEESFARYREEGGAVIIYMIPEGTVERALSHPAVLVASDGMPFVNGRAHPRGAGTFARVLGRYVREKQTIPLMDALAKMTYLPARRVEGIAPSMRHKGRIREGADADITIFDPARVIDRATFREPAQGSAGIRHVLVEGTFVVRDGVLVEGARPGRAIRSGSAGAAAR